MASHLKSLDSNHLVTVGEEGFWATGSAYESSNPGNGWAAITGQNFTANHASKSIDFAGIHVWPDNWEVRPWQNRAAAGQATLAARRASIWRPAGEISFQHWDAV